jgi:hypothetical protein
MTINLIFLISEWKGWLGQQRIRALLHPQFLAMITFFETLLQLFEL